MNMSLRWWYDIIFYGALLHSTMEGVEAMVVRNKFQEMTQHIKKWAPNKHVWLISLESPFLLRHTYCKSIDSELTFTQYILGLSLSWIPPFIIPFSPSFPPSHPPTLLTFLPPPSLSFSSHPVYLPLSSSPLPPSLPLSFSPLPPSLPLSSSPLSPSFLLLPPSPLPQVWRWGLLGMDWGCWWDSKGQLGQTSHCQRPQHTTHSCELWPTGKSKMLSRLDFI